MLFPTAPALLNPFIINATLDSFSSVHRSCLEDRYYGTYGDQSLYMVDTTSHCDLSGLKLELGWETGLIVVNPNHELLFLKRMEISGPISDEDTLVSGLEGLFAHMTDATPATPGAQWPLIKTAPMYSILYHTGYSAILSISPQFLPYVDKALPSSYKAYAISKIPLPFRRVSEDAKERIRRWADSVEYDDDIAWIVDGLPVSQLREDVRYLTGEDSYSPIRSRSSFSEGGHLAAEWIAEQIQETGAKCELKRFLPGFSPNVIWCALSIHSRLNFHE